MNFFITPHPPIIISEIGKGEEKKANQTIAGMKKIAKNIAAIKPKIIAVISPHGNVFRDALCINTLPSLYGDFGDFNYDHLSYEFKASQKANTIYEALNASGINCVSLDKNSLKLYDISANIDHGALVPLHFILKEYQDFELVHINMGFLSTIKLYRAGQIIADMLGDENVLIASGDLSHKLTNDAPAGFDRMGQIYDDLIVDSIKNKRYIDILNIDQNILNGAGQCAQKPFEMLIGALEGYDTITQVYSYEGPFGVGYMTARIIRDQKIDHSIFNQYQNQRKQNDCSIVKSKDKYVWLAQKTIEAFIKNDEKIDVPEDLNDEMYLEKRGVFVSIKKLGKLRGCIGTIEPYYGCIADEIINNAIAASTEDPRFHPIEEFELVDLEISVDILFPPEDINSIDELDAKEYGVIVQKGAKRGLLLPNLEGVDSAVGQVEIALQKAGIKESEKYQLKRFRVERHI